MGKIWIKDLYENVSEIRGKSLSPLELWYNELINKKIEDLSILDINRMLRQDVFMQLAMEKAMELLIKNPMEGELYDGDLLYQVVKAMKKHGASIDKQIADKFIELADKEKEKYEWEFEEYKTEYEEMLESFKSLARGKKHIIEMIRECYDGNIELYPRVTNTLLDIGDLIYILDDSNGVMETMINPITGKKENIGWIVYPYEEVIEQTDYYKENYGLNGIVFADDGAGNPYYLLNDKVYMFMPMDNESTQVAESLLEFFAKREG